MIAALIIGAAAQTSLLLSGLVVYLVKVPPNVIGALAGFGAGALIAAVAFDLIPESADLDKPELALWLLSGALVFVVSDRIVESRFGGEDEGGGGPLGIVVGSIVDGVPESLIFGIQLGAGDTLSASFIAAVWVSNIPQALAPSAALAESWPPARLGGMWASVVVVCGVVAALGYTLAHTDPDVTGERAAALAAGGLLAMLTNSLMPFAFERAGQLAGVATVVGFCVSLLGSS